MSNTGDCGGGRSRQIDHASLARIAWAAIAADAASLTSPYRIDLTERERRIVEALLAWRRAEIADGHGLDWGGDEGRRLARNAHRRQKRAGGGRAKRGRRLEPLTELDGALGAAGLSTAEALEIKERLGIEAIDKDLPKRRPGSGYLRAQNRAGQRRNNYQAPEDGELSDEDEALFDRLLGIGDRP